MKTVKQKKMVERTDKFSFTLANENRVTVHSVPDGRLVFELEVNDISVVEQALSFFKKNRKVPVESKGNQQNRK